MRAHWGSKLGFILATAGSAIGLGNIWRFPYLAGKYGGGTFLLAYILCVAGIAYFMLTAKLAFGRLAKTNIVDGFTVVAAKSKLKVSKLWGIFGGWLGFVNCILITAVYSVVIGWTACYMVEGLAIFSGISDKAVDAELFNHLTASLGQQLFWSILCILITSLVIIEGVKKGIEKVSLYLMPFLFVILLFMVVRILFLPNIEKGITFLLKPEWSGFGFTSEGFDLGKFCDLIMTAMGQAIYSLSLGTGVIFVYGSYLEKDVNIKKSAAIITVLDTIVAFLAGFIILPAVFAFGLEPTQGPGLSFISLPLVFTQMYAGYFLMWVFFILLFLAALTSLISIYESAVSLIMDKLRISRLKATGCMALTNIAISLVVLISFTGVWNIKLNGMNLFDLIDRLTGAVTMALMTIICCLFMGWKVYPLIVAELKRGAAKQSLYFETYLKWVLRIAAPIIVGIICLGTFL